MAEMGGLGRRMPVTGRCYLVGVLALAGVPIFNGFWSKDMLFASALHAGKLVPLALAVVTAVLTVTYSVRSYIKVFAGEPAPAAAQAEEPHPSMLFPWCCWRRERLPLGSSSATTPPTSAGAGSSTRLSAFPPWLPKRCTAPPSFSPWRRCCWGDHGGGDAESEPGG